MTKNIENNHKNINVDDVRKRYLADDGEDVIDVAPDDVEIISPSAEDGRYLPVANNKSATIATFGDNFNRTGSDIPAQNFIIIKNRSFIGGILALILGLIGALIALILLGVFFIAVAAVRVVSSIFLTIYAAFSFIISAIFQRLVSVLITFAIFAGGIYVFWHFNPELKASFDYRVSQVSSLMRQYIGIPLPNLVGVDDVVELFDEQTVNIKIPEFATLLEMVGTDYKDYIPKQLDPILNVIQDTETLKEYVAIIASGDVGNNAEKTVPLLAKALIGGNPAMQFAASQALKNINTPKAKRALAKFNRQIKRVLR